MGHHLQQMRKGRRDRERPLRDSIDRLETDKRDLQTSVRNLDHSLSSLQKLLNNKLVGEIIALMGREFSVEVRKAISEQIVQHKDRSGLVNVPINIHDLCWMDEKSLERQLLNAWSLHAVDCARLTLDRDPMEAMRRVAVCVPKLTKAFVMTDYEFEMGKD